MDEKHRTTCEDLFNKYSMSMSQTGRAVPLYIMITDTDEVYPILLKESLEMHEYATLALNIANQYNAKALIFICEQYMVSKKTGDADLSALLNGTLKPSEHPDREEYLTLTYMDEDANTESLIGKIEKDLMGTPFTRKSNWLDDTVTAMMMPWK